MTTTSTITPPPVMISNYHVDLWEHALKLYNLNHWQQAHDIFGFLGKDVPSARHRTLCLLNRSMVEARLGDYNKAALTIADAADLGEELPMTAFLAGLINWDLRQTPLAEAWFEACLTGIDEHGFDCREDGLNFVLERAEVQHNLDCANQAVLAQELGLEGSTPDELYYLPADMLFEAPPRSSEPSPTGDAPRLPFDDYARTDRRQSAAAILTGIEHPKVLSRVPSSSYSVASFGRDSLTPLICDEIWASPHKTSSEHIVPPSPAIAGNQKRKHTPIVVNHAVALASPAQPSPDSTAKELRSLERIRQREAQVHVDGRASPTTPRTKIPYTWHGQQRVRHEPRDARGQSDSVKELAHFVQEFAPGGSSPLRKIMTQGTRLKEAMEGEQGPSTGNTVDEYDKLAIRLGVISGAGEDGNAEMEQRKRAATFGDETGRPSLDRGFTRPVRSSSLRHAIHPPRPITPGKSRKANKVRWPFQDDIEEQAEPQPSEAPTAANSAVGIKPMPLDFIMGPDGKTIIIEKVPKAAVTVSQALQRVQDARRHGAQERETEIQDPVSPVGLPHGNVAARRHGVKERGNKLKDPVSPIALPFGHLVARKPVARQSPGPLSLLQPTVYEPPSWRKLKKPATAAPPTPSSTTKPARPRISAPFDPIHLSHLDEHSLTPPPLNISRRDPSAQSPMPSPEAATPSPRSGSRYVPSAVSSINMWDYLLDKMKPDEGKGAGKK